MVALGIFTSTSTPTTTGYSVIFNDQGKGLIYRATGDVFSGNLTFETPTEVNTGPFTLTANAVPVSMKGTGYLLDKVRTRSCILYYMQLL